MLRRQERVLASPRVDATTRWNNHGERIKIGRDDGPGRTGAFESSTHARTSLYRGRGSRSGMTVPPAAAPNVPPPASPDPNRGPAAPRKLSGPAIVIWAVIAGLGILFSVFAVAISFQAATFDLMRWLLALAIEAPLAAGIIALIWYGRDMHRATAAGEAGAQALAHSEAKYRALIASAPDGIFVLDPQAKVLDVNGAGEGPFGRSPAEIVGHPFMELVPPERLESARSYLADRLKGLRATELYEATFAARDLKPLHVQLRSQVVRPADAEPYVVYIVRDVTAQREALRKLVETERWASMGRLASFVAHEINTPLTNISLLTASISRRGGHSVGSEGANKSGGPWGGVGENPCVV